MAKLRTWAGRLCDIRPGEGMRLLLLYFLAFALNSSVVWGQAASEALFLHRIGPDYLPVMFIADALLTAGAVLVYGAFVDRVQNTRLMIAIALLGSLLLVGARVGLALELQLTYPLLYLVDRMLRAVITIHAWTYIADFYDTRTARRHFPLIGSGSRASGILAGLLIVPIVHVFNTESLLLAWIGALLASAGLAWLTPRRVGYVAPPKPQPAAPPDILRSTRAGFAQIAGSNFLRLIAVAAVVGTLLLYLLDYQSQRVFARVFTSSEELAAFYGVLGTCADLLTLPIQMFLLSRLVQWLGVGNANMIFPGLTAMAYTCLALLPTLPTAAFARVTRTAFRSAFRTPLDGLLFNAVAPTSRGRARTFTNGLLIPLGALLAGFILLIVRQDGLPWFVLSGIGLLIAVAYVRVSLHLRGAYRDAIGQVLLDAHQALQQVPCARPAAGVNTQPNSTHPQPANPGEEVYRFLDSTLNDLDAVPVTSTLNGLVAQCGPDVRAGFVRMLATGGTHNPVVRQFCLEQVTDRHPEVRRAAFTALISAPDAAGDYTLLLACLKALNDPDRQIQAGVIPLLIASQVHAY